MQIELELLAPAKNKDIGIAAIDCGADAVYIAGPSFGAREAAGNSIEDIALMAEYAHKYSAMTYVTVNTILFDNELAAAQELMWQAYKAGADAFIVQDLGILKLDLPPVALFASTQANIRTVEQAKFLESLGFKRLILERELSLNQISEIRNAVNCDLEFFVHGALCVSYSGQCYLSQRLAQRSANRGVCVQACRSKYRLIDSDRKIIADNQSILSLKDFKLDNHIDKLVKAGITSFKIEGRLKNISYIKNVVRHYRNVIDDFISQNPGYVKSSCGTILGGFSPQIDSTFNRGYTSLFIDGKRGEWNSLDVSKSVGEFLGTVSEVGMGYIVIDSDKQVSNGDGLAFVSQNAEVTGARADKCNGRIIEIKQSQVPQIGAKVYRSLNFGFERELEKNMPERVLQVDLEYTAQNGSVQIKAVCENGKQSTLSITPNFDPASNPSIALQNLHNQLSKRSRAYQFMLTKVESDIVYFYPISVLNSYRRKLSEMLDNESLPSKKIDSDCTQIKTEFPLLDSNAHLTYRANSSNYLSKQLYSQCGAAAIDDAYEIVPEKNAELIRSKYCIKYQLGLCAKQHPTKHFVEPLFLENNGIELRLEFDCKKCEMVVIL